MYLIPRNLKIVKIFKKLNGDKKQIIYKSSSGPSKGWTCQWAAVRAFHTSTCSYRNSDPFKSPTATMHSRVLLPYHSVIQRGKKSDMLRSFQKKILKVLFKQLLCSHYVTVRPFAVWQRQQPFYLFVCSFIYLCLPLSLPETFDVNSEQVITERNGTDRGCYDSTSFKKRIQVKETPKCHAFKTLKAGILKAITRAFKTS